MKKDYVVRLQVGYNEAHFNFKDDGEAALDFLTKADDAMESKEETGLELVLESKEDDLDADTDV